MKRIRVLIVDDQKLFAESMKIVLEGDDSGQIEVAGIAFNGREAVDFVANDTPDVILMDVRMPVMNGVDATRIIHEAYPEIKILILTTFRDDELVEGALGNGAAGYVLKEVQPEELIESIRAVNSGFVLMSESVGSKFFEKAKNASNRPADPDRKRIIQKLRRCFVTISKRESEVLYYMSRSLDNAEIAAEMYLAEQTVKNYITAIYGKLSVNDRVHCMRIVNECLSSPGG